MKRDGITKTSSEVQQFVELVRKGIEAWVEAGKIVARNLDANPNWADELQSACPEFTLESIMAFDRIGRRVLHPRLMLSECPGYSAARRLPFATQEKLLAGSVDLLVNVNGEWETLKVDLINLTKQQAKQVFDKEGVRSLAAQRAWIEGEALKRVAPETESAGAPFRIVKRTLVILEPCTITAKDIARLLAEME